MNNIRIADAKWGSLQNNSQLFIVLFVVTLAFGCGKNSSTPSVPNQAALLIKQVDISRNSQNVVFDSVVTLFQYDNNKNVTEIQQTEAVQITGSTINSSQTWAFTYTGSLISGSAESFTSQTSSSGVPTSNSSGQSVTTFYASGNNISYYKSITNITSKSFGTTVNSISYDSAEFGYNGNKISSYILYVKPKTSNAYNQLYKNAYTYSGDNLTGFVDIVTEGAGPGGTITGSYSYDNKTSYLPINYIVPGVYFYTPNNVTKLTEVVTGSTSLQQSYTYQWTYNSKNQPSACTATIATNPATQDNGTVVSSLYYYQ
jgi:hypothetical protein